MTQPLCTDANACYTCDGVALVVQRFYRTRCGHFDVQIIRDVGELVVGKVFCVSPLKTPNVLVGSLYPGKVVRSFEQYVWRRNGWFCEDGLHAMDLVAEARA